MITVTVLSGDHKPLGVGLPYLLVNKNCEVIGSAKADAAGVVMFDVDTTGLDYVGIRLDLDTLETMEEEKR